MITGIRDFTCQGDRGASSVDCLEWLRRFQRAGVLGDLRRAGGVVGPGEHVKGIVERRRRDVVEPAGACRPITNKLCATT